jgi:N-carbamoyl-L-amino-acid hydrolase
MVLVPVHRRGMQLGGRAGACVGTATVATLAGMKLEDIRVDGARLRKSLERMARIGATPGGGVQRLALSDEDREARDLFVSWLKELDLTVTVDQMGNIFGRRPGSRDDLAPVMSGSHVDSQPKGGRFDGLLGGLSMLVVMRTLKDHKV